MELVGALGPAHQRQAIAERPEQGAGAFVAEHGDCPLQQPRAGTRDSTVKLVGNGGSAVRLVPSPTVATTHVPGSFSSSARRVHAVGLALKTVPSVTQAQGGGGRLGYVVGR